MFDLQLFAILAIGILGWLFWWEARPRVTLARLGQRTATGWQRPWGPGADDQGRSPKVT